MGWGGGKGVHTFECKQSGVLVVHIEGMNFENKQASPLPLYIMAAPLLSLSLLSQLI